MSNFVLITPYSFATHLTSESYPILLNILLLNNRHKHKAKIKLRIINTDNINFQISFTTN